MVRKHVSAFAAAAVGLITQTAPGESGESSIGGRWICRLVPFIIIVPIYRLVIRLVVRLIRRCQRIPFVGLICWITGVQFLIIVTWVLIRLVLVYWRWVCRWVPTPRERDESFEQG
jgi:chromate transport protein ChrA